MPVLGSYTVVQPSNGKELLSVSELLLISSWERFLGNPYAPDGARRRRATWALCPAYVLATP